MTLTTGDTEITPLEALRYHPERILVQMPPGIGSVYDQQGQIYTFLENLRSNLEFIIIESEYQFSIHIPSRYKLGPTIEYLRTELSKAFYGPSKKDNDSQTR